MPQIETALYPGRIFYINLPARLTGTPTPLAARNLAVVAFPPGVPDEPPIKPRQGSEWGGWYPQCKPGLEVPWDRATWGRLPDPVPENFFPHAPVRFGEGRPLCKNELFPIIKKTRSLLGRDFYGFVLLFDATQAAGKINFASEECYHLIGNFQAAFEGYPAVDL
jgi:hypothetical protein